MTKAQQRAGRGRPTKMSDRTTLKQIGITRDQSSQWQRLAQVSEALLEDYFKDCETSNEIPSAEALLRRAGRAGGKVPVCPHCGGKL